MLFLRAAKMVSATDSALTLVAAGSNSAFRAGEVVDGNPGNSELADFMSSKRF